MILNKLFYKFIFKLNYFHIDISNYIYIKYLK